MTKVLNRESAVPLYIQLADELRDKITRGEWKPDQKIPSENELNQIYGISRMTVRQVLTKLVDEGLLFRAHGKGTFVARQKINTRSPVYLGVREQLEQLGYDTKTAVLRAETIEAGDRVARHLGVPLGTRLHLIERVRRAESTPVSLHESYVPEVLAPTLLKHDLEHQQLCHVLDSQFDLRMARVHETLESITPSKAELNSLGARVGTPFLLLEQRIEAPSGVPFEYTRIKFRGDLVRLEFDYEL